jgi:hypothetical protein
MLVSAAAHAARPQRDADLDPAEKESRRDDPRERREAMRMWRGETDAAARWRILQEALKQRDRYGAAIQLSAPVAGSVFINVGPTRADVEYNGGNYTEIDSGRARQIIPHPTDPKILYMATSGGGVWKSYDQGAGWEPITDSLGTLSVGTLAMDPSSPEVLYLGFGDPFDVRQPGIVQSKNGGATWSTPQPLLNGNNIASSVTDMKVDPTNSLIVIVTTDQGLFRSVDGGTSYQRVPLTGTSASDANFWMWSVAYVGAHTWLASGERLDPTGATAGGGLGLWLYSNDGTTETSTWNVKALPGGDAEAAADGRGTLATALSTVSDANTSRIYLVAGNKGNGAFGGNATKDVYRSDDGGKTFISLGVNASGRPKNGNSDQPDLNVMHEQAWYNQAITVDPMNADAVFVGGNLAMIRSLDGGVTWSVLSDWLPVPQNISRPYVHADFHAFAVGSDGTFYAGSDGGIFLSLPGAGNARNADAANVTFTSARNEGLVTHLVYNVACAPDNWPASMLGWMAGGLQDNGTRVRKFDTTIAPPPGSWSRTFDQLLGGDGIGLAVSAGVTGGVPNTFLASTPGGIWRSSDGGQNWTKYTNGMISGPPFFVRIVRDEAAAADTFLTYSTPAAMYSSTGNGWTNISGTLHWTSDVQGGPADTAGFTTPSGGAISLRNVAAHPNKSGLYGAVSNKFAYVTKNGGTDWFVSVRVKVPTSIPNCPGCGAYLLSSIAFDPTDQTGQIYYITSKSMSVTDEAGTNSAPMPSSFGHLYKTVDGGLNWTSLATQATAGGLPFVPISIVKVDPTDKNTLYVGTDIGLYKSVDGGQNFARFGGGSLPDVEVTDFCISATSKRLVAGTYGRGFWEISTDGSGDPAGVKGRGDTNFDFVVDGQDLIDLADAWGSTETSPAYRYQADLVGTANAVDDADLKAMLDGTGLPNGVPKFGGRP